ncbi:MAG: hypothetical protein IPQ16_01115 [Geobacteraceae bacterium]|nr:hypothetical protein [Geobacteraceae bacterium]
MNRLIIDVLDSSRTAGQAARCISGLWPATGYARFPLRAPSVTLFRLRPHQPREHPREKSHRRAHAVINLSG